MSGADENDKKLLLAVQKCKIDEVKSLISSGADPLFSKNPDSPHNSYDEAYNIQDTSTKLAMFAAITTSAVAQITKMPAEIRAEKAANTIHALLYSGSNASITIAVDGLAPFLKTTNNQPRVPLGLVLIRALFDKYQEMLTTLKKHGVTATSTFEKEQYTAIHLLMMSKQKYSTKKLDALIDAGVDIEATDRQGKKADAYALSIDLTQGVQDLIDRRKTVQSLAAAAPQVRVPDNTYAP